MGSLLIKFSFEENELESSQNLSIQCVNEFVCKVENLEEILEKNPHPEQLNLTIHAKFVGVTHLNVSLGKSGSDTSYKLRLLRSDWEHTKAKLFIISLVIFIPFITFLMGTQLELKKILELWKKPIGPCTGMLCQFGIMPLVSYSMAKFILTDEDVSIRLALFAAGTCPGGGKSSFWTIIWGGNLDLSISMTFSQHIAALVMMPIWIGTLGKEFSTKDVQIPYFDIIKGLIALMIPTIAGMIFITYKQHLYVKIQKWIKRIAWVATFFFMAIMIYSNFYIFFLLSWKMVFCACFLPWSGYFIALIVTTIFRMNYADKITIALETGIQHISIAVVIMIWSLPEPEVDLAVAILLVGMLMTDKPLVVLYGIVKLYKRCMKKEKTEKVTSIDEKKKLPPPRSELEHQKPAENA
ncbi:unnamed protein product, partial [Mesorhabditis belari]|uniref:Solute carrier family 10 member 6 n=1 Tax=Mesorhabditis belari TaxID=2138241 RepID=A0AAF3FG53_9BILA